jgi:predicted ATPase
MPQVIEPSAVAPERARFGLTRVEVRGFRTARAVAFSPGQMCALVGEANAGKSNLLAAIRALLEPDAAPIRPDDVAAGGDGTVSVRAELASGAALSLEGSPPALRRTAPADLPPLLFLPATARADALLARPESGGAEANKALDLFRAALGEQPGAAGGGSATAPALSVVTALERCCAFRVRGVVLLIEEPELYLRPQAQRYLYRLLREFALAGNQVIYSTHAPAFLNVARLDELVFVEREPGQGTRTLQHEPVTPEEDFRLLTEFDAERSELFLARAALLVEGQTEKLVLPFVFRALGHDADREAISIVECGGKSGIPFFARICRTVGVPSVAVHDRDAPRGRAPIQAERALNDLIAEVAGPERTIVLEPDFEAVTGLAGHSHKPERAWRRFATLSAPEMPEPLVRAIELAVSLAERAEPEGTGARGSTETAGSSG